MIGRMSVIDKLFLAVFSANWQALARHLGLSADLIDAIARDNQLSVGDYLSQVLKHWLQQNYNLPRK